MYTFSEHNHKKTQQKNKDKENTSSKRKSAQERLTVLK